MGSPVPQMTQFGMPYPLGGYLPNMPSGMAYPRVISNTNSTRTSAWQAPPQLITSFNSPGGYPVQLYQLGNGHRVIIEQRPTDIISLRTFIQAGSIYEDPIHPSILYGHTGFPSGIAHLDEHCHFIITQNFPKKNSWASFIESMGAQFNATTSDEMIQHELTFNKEDLPTVIAMHGEAVMRPLYLEQEIYQEKNNVINEAGERTASPGAKVFNKTWELLFDRPDFQTLGSKADVQRTTAANLKAFYDTYYRPDNMVTVISGNLDPRQALNAIDREFGSNPARPAPPEAAIQLALRPGEVRSATIADPQLNFSMVNIAFPGPSYSNIKDRVAMDFLMSYLGDGSLSLLPWNLKDRMGLVSAVDADYSPMKASGVTQVMLHTTPGREQQALGTTLQLLSTLSQQPIDPQKLESTRELLKHQFRRGLNDVEESTYALGSETLSNSLPYYLQYLQLVNSITAEDLRQAAQKYLDPTRYAVVFGIPKPQTNSNMGRGV